MLRASIIAILVAATHGKLPDNYESLPAVDKQGILWHNVVATPYNKLPTDNHGALESLQLMKPDFDRKAFTWDGDEMIEGRPKLIHTYGSAAKIVLNIFPNSTYSGIFKAGSAGIGIARLSVARMDPNNLIPGMVIKLLVNGKPSINIFSMNSVNGQGADKNFFSKVFTNFIPDAEGIALKLLSHQFREAIDGIGAPNDKCARPVGEGKLPMFLPALTEVPSGAIANPHRPPTVLLFRPNPAVGWSPDSKDDFRNLLSNIPTDSVLYTLAVKAQENSTKEEVIGQLVLKSQFVASAYEDATLYFKHLARSC